MSRDETDRARRFPWAALFFSALGFVMLVGLGTWQLQRLVWKEGVILAIDERIHSAPRPLSRIEDLFAVAGDVEYWPVEVQGIFDHGKEQHFLATHDGASGFFVYTPLVLADSRSVFVNRGFVPYDRKDPATRPDGQVDGVVTIIGLARNALREKPSSLVPDNDPRKNVFYWKDRAAMATSAGLVPDSMLRFFIDAGPAPNPGGLPVGGVTIVDLPNNHLQYALTWYGLAVALVAVTLMWLWQRGRTAPPLA
jgi:surfeit locus 1 family protein